MSEPQHTPSRAEIFMDGPAVKARLWAKFFVHGPPSRHLPSVPSPCGGQQ